MATVAVVAVITLLLGAAAGFLLRKYLGEMKIDSAEAAAKKRLADANQEAEAKKREAALEAKEEAHRLRKETERESKERRQELQQIEKRLGQKEEMLDSRTQNLDDKERTLGERATELAKGKEELEGLYAEQRRTLEQQAGLSAAEAREVLLQKIEQEIKHEAAVMIRDVETRAREEADKRARNVVSLAIQRCAADHVAESTVSVVALPGDDMKGRIIGREGRNIRAFETLTGINLIIDDTPEAVILSSFDPVRREIARLTLEKLIADGRIHPARIEEMFNKSEQEVETQIRETGEQTALDADVHGLHPELVRVIGRLRFRTSYGQNVLKHSEEVAHLAAMMAAEIGSDIRLAKRAGLLHDVGKAIDHEVEGPHAVIGGDLAKRLHESQEVCHAIEAHHADVEPTTVEAVLVQAADAVSAARPGARRETLESYVKRLETLEALAESYDGVERCYAMQAGREIRVMVKPDHIDDAQSSMLARDIARKIEEELEYPGQIKVTVIREQRAVEYAK